MNERQMFSFIIPHSSFIILLYSSLIISPFP
jgi:hypothetical protein